MWRTTVGVLVCLLAAIIYNIVAYRSEHATRRYPRVNVSSLDFRAGDVLLFVSHCHGFANSLLTTEFFSHSGIVVEDTRGGDELERLYVSEATIGSLFRHPEGHEVVSPGSTHLTPLYARLKCYPGSIFVLSLNKDLGGAAKQKLWDAAQVSTPYPTPVYGLLSLVFPMPPVMRHCMQHVAWMLGQIDFPVGSHTFLGIAKKIVELPQAKFRDGYQYQECRHALYDVDADITR